MSTKYLCVCLTLLAAGCSGSAASGNKVMNPPAADKHRAESILREHGVEQAIVALREVDDHWTATVSSTPPQFADGDGQTTSTPPAVYRVFKDGRVVDARDDKPLARK